MRSFWRGGPGRLYNRVASFFVYVDVSDEVEGGGTYFPDVQVDLAEGGVRGLVEAGVLVLGDPEQPDEDQDEGEGEGRKKGVTFKPVQGAAVFWVNLQPEGWGDERTLHAGLPVTKGRKTGCNLWVKRDFGW